VQGIREPDPFAPAPDPAPRADDPFAPSAREREREHHAATLSLVAATDTLFGPLARRDPDAPPEETAEHPITGAASFDDVLRRARRRGFLAGVAAGGAAGAALAAALVLLLRPGPPAVVARTAATASPIAAAELPAREPSPVAVVTAPLTPSLSPRVAGGAGGPPRDGVVAEREKPGIDLRGASAPQVDGPAGPEVADTAAANPAAVVVPAAVIDAAADAEPAADAAPAAVTEPAADVDPAAVSGTPAPAPDAEVATPAPAVPAAPRRLEEGEVVAALAARHDALEGCFAVTADDAGAPPGQVVRLLVGVDPSGRVSDVRIDDARLDASPLGVCVGRVVRAMSFEPFEGEAVRVELPLRLGGE
jgi:hypothetical protein